MCQTPSESRQRSLPPKTLRHPNIVSFTEDFHWLKYICIVYGPLCQIQHNTQNIPNHHFLSSCAKKVIDAFSRAPPNLIFLLCLEVYAKNDLFFFAGWSTAAGGRSRSTSSPASGSASRRSGSSATSAGRAGPWETMPNNSHVPTTAPLAYQSFSLFSLSVLSVYFNTEMFVCIKPRVVNTTVKIQCTIHPQSLFPHVSLSSSETIYVTRMPLDRAGDQVALFCPNPPIKVLGSQF